METLVQRWAAIRKWPLVLRGLAVIIILPLLSGCSSLPSPAPVTRTPRATPEIVAETTAVRTPAPAPTETMPPGHTPTVITIIISPTSTPTRPPSITPPGTIPETPRPTATPSPSPAFSNPTATPLPSSPAGFATSIDYFRADTDLADPGDTITLSWSTRQANVVTLYRLLPGGQLGSFWSVDPIGSKTLAIDPAERNSVTFLLFAGEGENFVDAAVTIMLTCPDSWFFTPAPEECPGGSPVISAGAYQPFERGHMLWIGESDRIYVLFGDGNSPRWKPYTDSWKLGDPPDDPAIVPPEGLFQPVRGFGLLWRTETGLRERVGWATESEVGYEIAWQRTARSKYNLFFMRAADGSVWRLGPEGSSWERLPEAQSRR